MTLSCKDIGIGKSTSTIIDSYFRKVDLRTVSFDVPPQEVRVCVMSVCVRVSE